MGIFRPRPKPKKVYPNSDRYGEDGRRIYSAYEAKSAPQQGSDRQVIYDQLDKIEASNASKATRRQIFSRPLQIVVLLLVIALGAAAIFVISQLPH
ncbi:MAG: hypothetical protein EOR57_27945 [Mesorhizobium sp.]|uniref:hypothetical protein n=1 Tax=Mesorhizobium sp. TaxID=1871066 RepID=UPI000FE8D8E4|nr:hypothetical protein [Mesorhizobium sp.]RWL16572.1 MAG: hypothetical protein EOR57_27945 [Mesorhizobium sp.]